MLSVRKEIYAEPAVSPHGKKSIRAEIDVDTVDELPEIYGISGKILYQDSTALIIKEGIKRPLFSIYLFLKINF